MTLLGGSLKRERSFDRLPTWEALAKLAEDPYDLTREGNLSPERVEKMRAQALGWQLLFATERVTDEVMDKLASLAAEADVVGQMRKMQEGEVVNYIEGYPSENRRALHTATRDFFDEGMSAEEAKKGADLARAEVEKLRTFVKKIGKEIKDVVMIGIGGSYLGPCAHYLAMKHTSEEKRKAHFVSNIDPDNAASVLRDISMEETLVLVVSKSGSTLETRANEAFFREKFVEAGIDPTKHFIAITGKGSPLDDPDRYAQSFYIWDWIGGRFSTTSMVGGVVLALTCGFEAYWELLRGAHEMDRVALEPSLEENLPLLAALLGIWNHNFLNCPTYALIPYSEALARFPAHIQQVEMESNGKRIDRQGQEVSFQTASVVWGEPGTSAQHSFYQMIHQGTQTIPIEFIGLRESQCQEDSAFEGTTLQQKLLSNLFAQAISLATGKKSENPNQLFPGNNPSHILLADSLTPYKLGALLSFFEHKIVFQGLLWGINSFDQEGVQLGKVLASRITARFAAANRGEEGELYPLADSYLELL